MWVLEYKLDLPGGQISRWVPVIPGVKCPYSAEGHSWLRWLFDCHHEAPLDPHRTETQTYHLVRRSGYWAAMAKDVNRWCFECEPCMKFRSTRTATGPLKSILGQEVNVGKLPWTDVIIDVQGPFTKAKTGECYSLSYTCTVLKVSLFEHMAIGA